MAASKGEISCDIELGPHRSSSAAGESDCSLCFSDAEDRSWHSTYNSNCVEGYRCSGASSHHDIGGAEESSRTSCCISDCSFEADLECGGDSEIKLNLDKSDKDCRICHLNLESNAPESGIPIVLGCSCKDDLAAAHKQCAETWFKIRGNKICEICGSTAKNVSGTAETELTDNWNESNNNTAPPAPTTETRSFWQGHRFLNFLLACMIFAFVISWLFHFNVPG